MDRLTPQHRSWNMSRIRSRDTTPERRVRSLLHRLGYRFRLHRTDLPGKPDIVLPRLAVAVFVHGCFWHRHAGCPFAYTPKTRPEFWLRKFRRNVERHAEVETELRDQGWKVVVVWECELRDELALRKRLSGLLKRKEAALSR